ncbi:hypothetical protein [Clostridium beijerinckii]|uniref:hypothetical protein n=1 Tax=Clostridium beijerinckii TaxID=1520 RepID=UPI00232CCC82|nr:hypothetical protein [Clostridium beijerinckii]
MSRKTEKIFAYVGCSWQIISGFITIFIYSIWIKQQGFKVTGSSELYISASQSVIDSIYSFSTTLGILFLGLGLLNLYLVRRLREDKIEKKIPIWFILCGILSYFLMDFLSSFTFIASGIITLARNKSIKIINNIA